MDIWSLRLQKMVAHSICASHISTHVPTSIRWTSFDTCPLSRWLHVVEVFFDEKPTLENGLSRGKSSRAHASDDCYLPLVLTQSAGSSTRHRTPSGANVRST